MKQTKSALTFLAAEYRAILEAASKGSVPSMAAAAGLALVASSLAQAGEAVEGGSVVIPIPGIDDPDGEHIFWRKSLGEIKEQDHIVITADTASYDQPNHYRGFYVLLNRGEYKGALFNIDKQFTVDIQGSHDPEWDMWWGSLTNQAKIVAPNAVFNIDAGEDMMTGFSQMFMPFGEKDAGHEQGIEAAVLNIGVHADAYVLLSATTLYKEDKNFFYANKDSPIEGAGTITIGSEDHKAVLEISHGRNNTDLKGPIYERPPLGSTEIGKPDRSNDIIITNAGTELKIGNAYQVSKGGVYLTADTFSMSKGARINVLPGNGYTLNANTLQLADENTRILGNPHYVDIHADTLEVTAGACIFFGDIAALNAAEQGAVTTASGKEPPALATEATLIDTNDLILSGEGSKIVYDHDGADFALAHTGSKIAQLSEIQPEAVMAHVTLGTGGELSINAKNAKVLTDHFSAQGAQLKISTSEGAFIGTIADGSSSDASLRLAQQTELHLKGSVTLQNSALIDIDADTVVHMADGSSSLLLQAPTVQLNSALRTDATAEQQPSILVQRQDQGRLVFTDTEKIDLNTVFAEGGHATAGKIALKPLPAAVPEPQAPSEAQAPSSAEAQVMVAETEAGSELSAPDTSSPAPDQGIFTLTGLHAQVSDSLTPFNLGPVQLEFADLTLGSSTQADTDYGFTQATVSNSLTFEAPQLERFMLHNAVILSSDDTGTISGADLEMKEDGASLQIQRGSWTASNALNVGGHAVFTVDKGAELKAEQGLFITRDLEPDTLHLVFDSNKGRIEASTLSLNASQMEDQAIPADARAVVKGGVYTVHDKLSTNTHGLIFEESELHLDNSKAVASVVTNDLLLRKSFGVIHGSWTLQDLALDDVSDMIVGAPKQPTAVTTQDLSLSKNSTLHIAPEASLTAENISSHNSRITVDGGMMKVKDGFDIDGNLIDVKDSGRFVIGESAAQRMLQELSAADPQAEVDQIKIDDAFGHYRLTPQSTLHIDFAQGVNLNYKQYLALRSELLASSSDEGIMSLGGAQVQDISSLVRDDGTIDWNEYQEVKAYYPEVKNLLLDNVMTGVSDSDSFEGHVAAVAMNSNASTLSIIGQSSFSDSSKNQGYFASVKDADGVAHAANLNVAEQQSVVLKGSGQVHDIVLKSGASLSVESPTEHARDQKGVVMNSLKGGDVQFKKGTTVAMAGTVSDVENLHIAEDVTSTFTGEVSDVGTVESKSDLAFAAKADIQHLNADQHKVSFADEAHLGTADVKHAVFKANASVDQMQVKQGATVDAAADITVGQAQVKGGQVKAEHLKIDADKGAAQVSIAQGGRVQAQNLTAAQDALIQVGVDGADGGTGSLEVQTAQLQGGTLRVDPDFTHEVAVATVYEFTDGNVVDGNVDIGQNSIVGFGVHSSDELKKVEFIKNHLTPEGALQQDFGSILYLDKHITIDKGYSIRLKNEAASTAFATPAIPNSMTFGANSYMVINGQEANDEAFVTFKGAEATLIADGGAVVLSPDTTAQSFRLFGVEQDDGSAGVLRMQGSADSIKVLSKNALVQGELKAVDGQVDGVVQLSLDKEKVDTALAGASQPLQDTVIAYFEQGNHPEENQLLHEAVFTNDGTDIERVARFASYGGAYTTAFVVGQATEDMISSRLGMGTNNELLSVAGNGQGGGLWVAPLFSSYQSDDYSAQGLDYGHDFDFGGVMLGADYTTADNFRMGVAFSVGRGELDGSGVAKGVKNEFEFYGGTAYLNYSDKNLSVTGDLSYTAVHNDIKAEIEQQNFTQGLESSTLSLGVDAAYAFEVNENFSIAPHLGLHYSRLNVSDYDYADSAHVNNDVLEDISIPAGVTFAAQYDMGAWSLAPSLDLNVTAHVGDDKAEGSVDWSHFDGYQTKVESEVIDSITYGATAGLSAQYGDLHVGLGLQYTGSEHSDNFGAQVSLKFTF